MAETERDIPETPTEAAVSPDETPEDDGAALELEILRALAADQTERVREVVLALHYADVADLLERLPGEQRGVLVETIRDEFNPEILSELDETVRDEVIGHLGTRETASALRELDSDDAIEVLEELDEEQQQQLLDHIPAADRTFIEEGLKFPEDSAGRLMQREMVTVPTYWTVGDTIDYMRRTAEETEQGLPSVFYDIFVVDPKGRPAGAIPLSLLLRSKRPVKVTELMETELNAIPVTTDQEDVAFLFRQRDLVSAPVVDDGGRLVGAITIDDVVDVIHEEHEEDVLRLGGVIEDDLYRAAIGTTRARFSWLVVNLLTAVVASVVIGLFDATIEQIVALAVLMPIVASMGGNAGTQTLTVTVRALAMKELTATNMTRVIGKETLVGAINGVLFAVLAGLVAWAWFQTPLLGGVIAAAMVINMLIAGLAGTLIPIALNRVGIDPAIASTVFLTTVTDVVGFFAFLGLAAIVLL